MLTRRTPDNDQRSRTLRDKSAEFSATRQSASSWRRLGDISSLAMSLAFASLVGNFAFANQTVTESGVVLENSIFVHGQRLMLVACGTRDALWSDIFVTALYLPASADTAALGAADTSKAIRLTVSNGMLLPNAIPQKYSDALATVLTPRDLHTLAQRFAELSEHDTVWLAYAPRPGLSVAVNGETILTVGDHQPVEAILAAWSTGDSWNSKMQDILSKHRC